MGSLLGALALPLVALPIAALAQPFDNQAVIALHAAGLGDDTILAKIASLPCNYDTSTGQLIALKHSGLSDTVIAHMVRRCTGAEKAQGLDEAGLDPASMHKPGIYLAQGAQAGPPLKPLRPTISSAIKVVGNGSILFPRLAKVVVPLGHAQAISQGDHPVFWFYFNKADKRVNEFGGPVTQAAQSPSEYSLVHLRVDGDVRQFVIGRVQPYVGVTGVDPKYAVAFDVNEVSDGIFRVEMVRGLEPGEYAFVLPGTSGRNTTYQMYDFEVTGAQPPKPAGTR
ncbi:MAG: hypothetical protein KGJ57_02520 [Sphingomonadales bacterium]|nr:hypothetical protein [Sphingomonadales bacterium]MDE2168285.1 hypothetical protein [Sphingomonadales bacterium]